MKKAICLNCANLRYRYPLMLGPVPRCADPPDGSIDGFDGYSKEACQKLNPDGDCPNFSERPPPEPEPKAPWWRFWGLPVPKEPS